MVHIFSVEPITCASGRYPDGIVWWVAPYVGAPREKWESFIEATVPKG